ncbi:MAG: transposase [Nitrospira sp.]|nr:transposase [Nitrospira sp.]MDE0404771.1 transposase [Nitrospira sp.]
MNVQTVIGIDISAKFLDVHLLPANHAHRFAHDTAGLAVVVALAQAQQATLVVMEATGGLESPLAVACGLAQVPTAVVNPSQIRDFARALLPVRRRLERHIAFLTIVKTEEMSGVHSTQLLHFVQDDHLMCCAV